MTIQGRNIVEDLHVLSLDGVDIVLGIFEFTLNSDNVSWKGYALIDVQPVQLHSLRRMAASDLISSYFHLELVSDYESSCTTVSELEVISKHMKMYFRKL